MKKIVGIFDSEENAINAIENLSLQGVEDDEISVITEDEESYQAIKNRTGLDLEEGSDVPSSTLLGAATGGTIGGLGGLLLGLGALAIPGIGPIVAAGPIAAGLMGTLAGGAVGGLAGSLKEHGIPKDEAHEYEERIHAGDIMILVEDNDDTKRREAVHENFRRNNSHNKHTHKRHDGDETFQPSRDSVKKTINEDHHRPTDLVSGEHSTHDLETLDGDNPSEIANPFKDKP